MDNKLPHLNQTSDEPLLRTVQTHYRGITQV